MVIWQRVLAGVVMAGASWTALADSLNDQRDRYQQIQAAWDNNDMASVSSLMPTLRAYPLYPYLEFRQLNQNISSVPVSDVKRFVNTYSHSSLSSIMTTRFVNELARRSDWRSIVDLTSQAPDSETARCNYYYAQWATGKRAEAWIGASEMWNSGQSKPNSCDKLFDVWKQSGLMSTNDILQRLFLAYKAGNSSLVGHLTKQLPSNYKSTGDAVQKLQSDPLTLTTFVRTVTPSDFSRKMSIAGLANYARKDMEGARLLVPSIVQAQRMNANDRAALEEGVVWRMMGNDLTGAQQRWADEVIGRTKDAELIERRIRLALTNASRSELNTWLAKLPPEDAAKDEWVYWKAVDLLEGRNKAEGEKQLRQLTQKRGFYPMAAAQKLNIQYPVRVEKATVMTDGALMQLSGMPMVRELMYWGDYNRARSEWRKLLMDSSRQRQEALARYAFERNWAELSVQATIVAKLWDHLEERFPLAWTSYYQKYLAGKSVRQSYAMAITRQESAWNPSAVSPAGARGLMQVMPATASQTTKRIGMTDYRNSNQLLDPETNIAIGTAYLEYVYQKFGANRIFSSAAYNAGPSRVVTWQNKSAGRLDAIAFVETIPFKETRNYVKSVLSYDVFYRHFMKQPTQLLTNEEWNRRY